MMQFMKAHYPILVILHKIKNISCIKVFRLDAIFIFELMNNIEYIVCSIHIAGSTDQLSI